jgi:hypothetical protein
MQVKNRLYYNKKPDEFGKDDLKDLTDAVLEFANNIKRTEGERKIFENDINYDLRQLSGEIEVVPRNYARVQQITDDISKKIKDYKR